MIKRVVISIIAVIIIVFSLLILSSRERVEPNEIGVLVQNYGKNIDKDYSITTGKVYTFVPGTYLYKIPSYEQRSTINEPIISKTSDNSQFTVKVNYSYKVDSVQVKKVIREHSNIFKEGNDLKEVEKRSLNLIITDVVREIISETTSTNLMSIGGTTTFNKEARKRIDAAFKSRGFVLQNFSPVLEASDSVKSSIDSRNQADSEIATLDSKIIQAEKQAKLSKIEAQTNIISGESITEQQLKKMLIQKWDGKLPSTYICSDKDKSPLNLVLQR